MENYNIKNFMLIKACGDGKGGKKTPQIMNFLICLFIFIIEKRNSGIGIFFIKYNINRLNQKKLSKRYSLMCIILYIN